MSELLESVEVATGPSPAASVIWMHGLGADGYDFVPIVRELDINSLPGLEGGVRFVFPHAPTRAVTINGGMVMRAWYDIKMIDLVRQEDQTGLRQSQAQCEALIAREVGRGMPERRIVVAGFSQGGAVALQTGLRHGARLAGLMVLSSYLPLATHVAGEASAANRDLPIFMAHGVHDPVIALDRAATSKSQLEALGYKVEWHQYPMQHSLSPEEIGDIRDWLGRVLG